MHRRSRNHGEHGRTRNQAPRILAALALAAVLVAPRGEGAGPAIGIGVYRSGVFYLRKTASAGEADLKVAFGEPGDIPVTGDWNGDGITDLGVYRQGTFLLRTDAGSGPPDQTVRYGEPGDTPVVGDWTGDGISKVGVFRDGVFHLRLGLGMQDIEIHFGSPGDVPLAGKWTAGGRQTGVGVFRGGTFYLRHSLSSGPPDATFTYGTAGDVPVVVQSGGRDASAIGIFRDGVFRLRSGVVIPYGSPGDIPLTGRWSP